MGVDVHVVRKESRHRVTEVYVVPDLYEQFTQLIQRVDHPLLNRINPYGFRELGSIDMPDFIAALDAVGAEGPLFDDLRALAELCGEDRSLTMQFQGD
ncbi:hypothetical protein [Lentzea flava]|uniref:Uncharacterized protein n=1 Tax=Lentzea flava TaxID=103732 RepID=A0ABQ2UZR4_9PSEU|nr:hypothetical protein [Lentzea flava]MCP2202423.1 hypothetical protein [Lentzea flava]GGU61312.1 hypothetical protein GCM10010178_61990 [Lentzea flava]